MRAMGSGPSPGQAGVQLLGSGEGREGVWGGLPRGVYKDSGSGCVCVHVCVCVYVCYIGSPVSAHPTHPTPGASLQRFTLVVPRVPWQACGSQTGPGLWNLSTGYSCAWVCPAGSELDVMRSSF